SWIFIGARFASSAWQSVLAQMNSTPSRLAPIIVFTALPPPPPTPKTTMRACWTSSNSRRAMCSSYGRYPGAGSGGQVFRRTVGALRFRHLLSEQRQLAATPAGAPEGRGRLGLVVVPALRVVPELGLERAEEVSDHLGVLAVPDL